jgi:formyl-CoA transferase
MQARGGLMRAQGGADEPVFHTVPYNDYCAGALAALMTVAALVARERTGRGQRVDVSLFRTALIDQAAAMIACARPTAPVAGGRDFLGPSAARRLYACADGWLAIGADAHARAALAQVVGTPLGITVQAIERWCAARPRPDALAALEAAGVPAAPCLGVAEVFDDPHLVANGAFVQLDDLVLGSVTVGGPLVGLSRTPIRYRRSAPPLGAHAGEILREIGITDARIAALVGARVVRGGG